MYTTAKYGRRLWAVWAPSGDLICVTLYKKGATRVATMLNFLDQSAEVTPW